ncbi:MAG TPA: indole-3-glycerol phosphate synthase TrpC [Gemmatimonadaceae bacterium]|nr:indole-3-glycerol phosphate synthase TrpC [Gemmatimonadaceae bacterium]
MQANRAWSPPAGPLGRLSAAAALRAKDLETRSTDLRDRAKDAPVGAPFAAALRRTDVGVIAEVKRSSPSKGVINAGLDAAEQASAYARGGAAALSILTEPTEFGGRAQDLVDARGATTLPTLKKDFHVHPVQVVEARAIGASALLLIARALRPDDLRAMADCASELGVEVLVEVRDEEELERALTIEHAIIGVNSRDLETLVIDPGVTSYLIPMIPADRLAVAESGVSGRRDVERAAGAGADAVLVGSTVSASPDPTGAVARLTGVARLLRAG